MSDTTFIYALCEPDTGEVRYVGKANNPRRRFWNHLHTPEKSHKKSWIENLRSRGQVPSLQILLEVPKADWQFWERDIILLFRECGCDLVNLHEGGEGGTNPTDETRRKQSEIKKGKKHSKETCLKIGLNSLGNTNMLGKHHTLEARQAMSAARRGRKDSPEVRERKRAAALLRGANPEYRKKLSLAHVGRKASEEARSSMRAGQARRFAQRKQEAA